jgi:uncharacterized protein (TIGR02391 family)
MPSSTVTLSDDQWVLLQTVYDQFDQAGEWPVFQHLDALLDQDRGLHADEVLMTLWPTLVRVSTPVRPDTRVELRIAGLAHCDGSEPDLVLFARLLRWTVAKESLFRPLSATQAEQQIVTSEEAEADLEDDGISTLAIHKAFALLAVEHIYDGYGHTGSEWTITLSPSVRQFRDVRTYVDYLRRLDAQPAEDVASRMARAPIAMWPPQLAPVAEVNTNVDHALTPGSLHPLVSAAVEPLFAIEHYAEGVEKAVRALRDLVRVKSGFSSDDGDALMGKALGGKDPPIIVADLSTDTGKNMQRGTLQLAQGIVARLRNPLIHQTVELEPLEALEMAALISRVVRDVDGVRDASDAGEEFL